MVRIIGISLLLCIIIQKTQAQTHNVKDSIKWEQANQAIIDYYNNDKVDSAIFYALQNKDLAMVTFGKQHPNYAHSLNNLAFLYESIGNYTEAEPLYKEALSIRKKILGEDHPDYAQSLNNLAGLYESMANYAAAEPLYIEALAIRKNILGENHVDYATSLENLAFLYNNMANYISAETFYLEALVVRKKVQGENHPSYANTLSNLAGLYQTIGNYTAAEPLFKEALTIRKNVLGINHPSYTQSLNNLAVLYETMGHYAAAELLHKEALAIRKKTLGENHPNYANTLNNLASLYETTGNYAAAEPLYKEALTIRKNVLGVSHPDYASSLNNLAGLYESMCNYAVAEPLYKESLAIRKKVLGQSHPSFANCLNNLAVLYKNMGNYSAAEPLYKEALAIRKNVLGESHPDYAQSLNNLAVLYKSMGNYIGAEPLFKEALEIRKKILGENHPSYAGTLNNLAGLYENMDNYTAAEPLYKEALTINRKALGENHPTYATSLNNLASYYESIGNYTEAEPLYKQALIIRKNILGENHPDYASNLSNLAVLYKNVGNYAAAEPLYKEALVIHKKVLGESHPNYANSLNHLASLYYTSKNIPLWQSLIATTIYAENNNQQLLLKNFSETEKETYLQENSEMQSVFQSMLYYFGTSNTTSFYQNANAKQGWLLQGKQNLNRLAFATNNKIIEQNYLEWQNTNNIYAKAIQLTIEKRQLAGVNTDSLQYQSQLLEKKLIEQLPDLQGLLINNGVSAKQVSLKLQPREAVIQWVSFKYKSPTKWTDSTLYAAYIIIPNDTVAKFVTVFEERQLQQLIKSYHGGTGRSTIKKESNTVTSDAALYNLIWKPLLPYLQNIQAIYNIPSGLLHKVSFAALENTDNNKQLVDEYEIHQLLSITELVYPSSQKNNAQTIALFGGANYDAAIATTTQTTVTLTPTYRNASSENKNIRFSYLPGTKTEVETVAANTKNTNWKVVSFINDDATEDNFKKVGINNPPQILHIATHGFYFPPITNASNNSIDYKNVQKDFPLLRSGLVLTGVNNYWGKDTLLENKEDGIVTAQEISNLNLLNTDLVVLSACQTALGDISGSEGVYGLQRAFKMAGAKKLLMSLWEVPDAETAELMQLFYGNVFKGDSYYTAFRKAQLALKAKFKDPTKWAGFVLVGE